MTKVPLHNLFDIFPGNSLDLNVLEETDTSGDDIINYVSRTRENNGVSARVKLLPEVTPFTKGLITVAGSGNSVLESFIQPGPFYTGYHVFVLSPKKAMKDLEKLFYCYCIRQNQYKYSYGRQANRTLKNLLVPDKVPEKFLNINVKKPSATPLKRLAIELDISTWKTFKYGGDNGIFDIKNGYYNKKPEHTEKGNIPFIGASEFNNGVTEYYSLFDIENNHKDERSPEHDLEHKIFKGNCITVNNNGTSVGNGFYQEKDFTCSHDVNVLYLKERAWNKYIALFICTIIQLEKYRWAYGRKWRPVRMPDSEIRLPVDSKGKPDWLFMEKYIKSLSYSSSI
jgi:type I restriction modification DNA specificity protein